MTTKRLGRGLADLIETTPSPQAANLLMLRADQVRPNRYQPRTDIDDASLEELKASIKRQGVLEPIVVRPVAHGIYELVAGERRLQASRALGITDVPAIVKTLSDQEALAYALVENVQRKDLNPMDEAGGYARLTEEFGYTQEEVAAAVGKDRATVANLLRLLKLPAAIQQGLRAGRITLGHGKVLVGVEAAARQVELYEASAGDRLTVRQLETLVASGGRARRRHRAPPHPELAPLEDQLRRALGTKVSLSARRKGGRIVIEYYSSEDLTRLLQALGVGA